MLGIDRGFFNLMNNIYKNTVANYIFNGQNLGFP